MEERQDLISRQVAIDALRDAENHAFNSFYKGLAKAHKIIADLPSVQPDHVANISKKVEGDCISRQMAIDAMKDALDPHIVQFVKSKMAIEALPSAQPERVCVANVTLTDEQVKEVVEKAKNAVISVIELEPHWIPCSERLPEENGQYLITIKYKHVNDSYEDVYAEHGEWLDGKWDMFCFGHCGEVEDIIAWMPLPEPYKG